MTQHLFAWLAALLVLALPVRASDLIVQDAADNELHVQILPAAGDLLALWLVDHVERRPAFEALLQAMPGAGIEVWRVDLLADYFLPRSSENVRTLPGDGVAALLQAAHRHSGKTLLLVAYDRMPLPLLRGVRQWQGGHRGPNRLAGAVLFYPNLFGPPPPAGEDPRLDPVVQATNIPLVIYQPERGTQRWRLGQVMPALWQAGSPAFARLVPGVRDWFFMHPPEEDPAEARVTAGLPAELARLARLLDQMPRPAAAAAAGAGPAPAKVLRDLVPLPAARPAPQLALPDLNGAPPRRDGTRGRVTLVNFWATWCPPCVEEVPSLNRLVQDYAERPFAVVSVDFREPAADVRAFTERIPVAFPILMDRDGRASLDWKVFSFPSSFLLDRHGRVRWSVNRAIDWDAPEARAVIDGLLAESP